MEHAKGGALVLESGMNMANRYSFADTRQGLTRARARNSALIAIAATAGLMGAAGQAQAALVLDTGTPTGSTALTLSTSQSLAAEFSIGAGETVTSLSAYLGPNSGNGTTFEFEIFSNATAVLGSAARGPTVVLQPVSATLSSTTGAGWATAAVNWAPAAGDYWLVLLQPTTGTVLDAPTETSTTTGSAPAIEFASTNTPGTRYSILNSGIGLQITAVPLPATAWLLLGGLGALGAASRRRKAI